jgi:ABC-type multidrug transport system permease subunit
MKYKKWLLKYMTPFLLVSYVFSIMAVMMIVRGNTGFGLPFIGFLIIFALSFILFDFILKKLLKKKMKLMLLLEATISMLLLVGSLYLEFKKSEYKPQNINVEPVKVSE